MELCHPSMRISLESLGVLFLTFGVLETSQLSCCLFEYERQHDPMHSLMFFQDQDGKGSGSICSTRRGRRPGTRSSSGGGGSSAGSDAGGAAGSKGEGDGNSGKRRRKRRRRLEAAKVVIREAVVASFDQTDGLYVLQRVDGEVEKMNLENLQTALQQSQVTPPH